MNSANFAVVDAERGDVDPARAQRGDADARRLNAQDQRAELLEVRMLVESASREDQPRHAALPELFAVLQLELGGTLHVGDDRDHLVRRLGGLCHGLGDHPVVGIEHVPHDQPHHRLRAAAETAGEHVGHIVQLPGGQLDPLHEVGRHLRRGVAQDARRCAQRHPRGARDIVQRRRAARAFRCDALDD